jgi:hypothetical protein
MSESKFIELLNLYIDHQISHEEAALLEEEIRHNPERRQTYRQYCRMQRACTLVLDQCSAPSQRAEREAGEIVGFQSTGRRPRWGYYAAGLAAAAIALVAVQQRFHAGRDSAQAQAPVASRPDRSLVSAEPARTIEPMRLAIPAARLPAHTEVFIDERLRVISALSTPDSRPAVFADPPSLAVSFSLPEVLPAPRNKRPTIEQFVFAAEPPAAETPRIFRSRQQTEEEAYKAALQYHR